MDKHTLRVAAAIVGASAVVAMGTVSVAEGVTQAQANTVLPESYGWPANTTVYNPPAQVGVPTQSSSSPATPTG
ncbi:MAG: hypothetical protein QOC63_5021 [Mycobacterium sp.]|nr:hypothetical protein [Mycobacterium sp.]